MLEIILKEVKMLQKHIKYVLILLFTTIISCSQNYSKKSKDIVAKMTIDQKIGQLVIIGINGKEIDDENKKIIQTYYPGGIILFGYNIDSNLKTYLSSMQNFAMNSFGIPMFITVDQEGGRVKRIKKDVTQFPGNMAMGSSLDYDSVYKAARILGIQLRKIGVNMNLAPDVDVNVNPNNPVINTRSFGSDTEVVSKMGEYYINGLQDSKCMAVAKHFPGHGDTSKDSHKILPVIPYNLERLKKVEFVPFINAIDNNVAGLMSAHISYPKVLGNDQPATLSKEFMTKIIRKDLKFDGLIMTDDLEMNAIAGNLEIGDAAVKAIEAGVDIILITSYGKNVKSIIAKLKTAYLSGKLSEARINQSVQRIIKYKLEYSILKETEDGRIVPDYPEFSNGDKDLLNESKEINQKLSTKSLYFYNKNERVSSFSKPVDYNGLLLSDSKILNKIITKNRKNWFVENNKTYLKFINKYFEDNKTKNVPLNIYYSIYSKNDKRFLKLKKLKEKYKFNLILISTKNPFEITAINNLVPTLFSFSNTDESYVAISQAMLGKIEPKTKINIKMGIDRNK